MAAVDRLQDLQQISNKATASLSSPPSAIPVAEPEKPQSKEKKEKKKRKKSKHEKEEKRKKTVTFAADKPPGALMEMDLFYKQMEETNEKLEKIKQNCEALQMAHQIILNSVSEIEISEQEKIINAFVSSTNQTSANLRQLLQKMEDDNQRLQAVAPVGSGDLRIRQLNTANLMKKFSNLMKQFQEIQQTAQTQHQDEVERQYKVMRPEASSEELEQVSEAMGAMNLTTQQVFSLGSTKDPLQALEEMKSRRQDVMDIEKGIYTLHQLCIDFDNLLEMQQGVLDSLEDHMESAVAYSEEAQGHMVEAVESQKNIRRLKCSIF